MQIICFVLLLFSSSLALAAGRTPTIFSIADVVEKVIPGVVNIQTRVVNGGERDSLRVQNIDKLFQMFLIPGAGGKEREQRSLGSGFFYGSRTFVVTNFHVVKDAEEIELVLTPKGKHVKAMLLGKDEKNDVAVLKVTGDKGNFPLRFGASDKLRMGDPVFAIGNPFGFGHTVTSGILSAKGRTIGSGPLNEFLQIDAAINPGNSGGPLFNLRGEVVGMNTATTIEGQGISFALPAEIVRPIVDDIIRFKKHTRAWVGVVISDLVENQVESNDTTGVYVQNIVKDSPADKSGLRVGDVIMGIGGHPAQNAVEFQKKIQHSQPGTMLSLRVFRNGSHVKVAVPIEIMPEGAKSY